LLQGLKRKRAANPERPLKAVRPSVSRKDAGMDIGAGVEP
jgi:hypothetical protein